MKKMNNENIYVFMALLIITTQTLTINASSTASTIQIKTTSMITSPSSTVTTSTAPTEVSDSLPSTSSTKSTEPFVSASPVLPNTPPKHSMNILATFNITFFSLLGAVIFSILVTLVAICSRNVYGLKSLLSESPTDNAAVGGASVVLDAEANDIIPDVMWQNTPSETHEIFSCRETLPKAEDGLKSCIYANSLNDSSDSSKRSIFQDSPYVNDQSVQAINYDTLNANDDRNSARDSDMPYAKMSKTPSLLYINVRNSTSLETTKYFNADISNDSQTDGYGMGENIVYNNVI